MERYGVGRLLTGHGNRMPFPSVFCLKRCRFLLREGVEAGGRAGGRIFLAEVSFFFILFIALHRSFPNSRRRYGRNQ